MREIPPLTFFLVYSPSLFFSVAETKQVHAEESSNNEESPEPETSSSRRRFKASNMAFVEMVEMVDILKRTDYDGKYGLYRNPNVFSLLLYSLKWCLKWQVSDMF
ncbi:hypothetical protein AB205_0096510 [Aquarana catesbeiana]|uniref:Uncharacterized protein n=1 Tax=Aquarana catesbeiana TaxID=8400 RepID=A0A2G9SL81_AQUCT|nr:hypothetical protein AB205_0096510 [Aquarana catesbeiana]